MHWALFTCNEIIIIIFLLINLNKKQNSVYNLMLTLVVKFIVIEITDNNIIDDKQAYRNLLNLD